MTAPGILVPSAMNDPRRYMVPYAAPAETVKAQKQPMAIALSVNGDGARESEKSSPVPGDSALDIFCDLYDHAEIHLARDGIKGVDYSHAFDGHLQASCLAPSGSFSWERKGPIQVPL